MQSSYWWKLGLRLPSPVSRISDLNITRWTITTGWLALIVTNTRPLSVFPDVSRLLSALGFAPGVMALPNQARTLAVWNHRKVSRSSSLGIFRWAYFMIWGTYPTSKGGQGWVPVVGSDRRRLFQWECFYQISSRFLSNPFWYIHRLPKDKSIWKPPFPRETRGFLNNLHGFPYHDRWALHGLSRICRYAERQAETEEGASCAQSSTYAPFDRKIGTGIYVCLWIIIIICYYKIEVSWRIVITSEWLRWKEIYLTPYATNNSLVLSAQLIRAACCRPGQLLHQLVLWALFQAFYRPVSSD